MDNVGRICILINWLGLRGLTLSIPPYCVLCVCVRGGGGEGEIFGRKNNCTFKPGKKNCVPQIIERMYIWEKRKNNVFSKD